MPLTARWGRAGGRPRDPAAGRRLARGFTLVELLVVIAIAAAMMAIIVPSYVTLSRQNKQQTCAAHLKALGQALAIFHEDYGCYPPDETEYLWTPEAVQEYARLYPGETIPTEDSRGELLGAAYTPEGLPFAPDPSYTYYKDESQAVHGLGLLTLYYLGAYSSVLPPLSAEPRITADIRSGAVVEGNLKPSKGYNQPYFTWYRGSGYIAALDSYHCPANEATLDPEAIKIRARLPGLFTTVHGKGAGKTGRREYWNNYDQFYRRNFWDPGSLYVPLQMGNPDLTEAERMDLSLAGGTRNLCVPYPAADTVITWCPYHHRGYIPRWPGDAGDDPARDKIAPGDMDLVLLVDGSVRRVLATQQADPYNVPLGESGSLTWPREPVM